MVEKKPFGEYIRKKRLEAGLTQKELAGRLFVTESSVSKWGATILPRCLLLALSAGGPLLKAGVCPLITAFASPAFHWLCRRVIPEANEPWLLDYVTFAVLLVLALVLLAVGAGKQAEEREE